MSRSSRTPQPVPPPNENKGLTQNLDVKVDQRRDARMKGRMDNLTKTIDPLTVYIKRSHMVKKDDLWAYVACVTMVESQFYSLSLSLPPCLSPPPPPPSLSLSLSLSPLSLCLPLLTVENKAVNFWGRGSFFRDSVSVNDWLPAGPNKSF